MHTLAKFHWIIIVMLLTLGCVAYTQSQFTTISQAAPQPESARLTSVQRGEWVEFVAGTALLASAAQEDARPTSFPYFYLAENWDSCTEYTADAPYGKPCSVLFDDLLKQAEQVAMKE